jgi:hypothetical protein
MLPASYCPWTFKTIFPAYYSIVTDYPLHVSCFIIVPEMTAYFSLSIDPEYFKEN